MLTQARPGLFKQLRQAAIGPSGGSMTDGQLLERFQKTGDEAAFAALVRRHGPMVWNVCRRRLEHHDAEDAFQATFMVLVRKASSIVPRSKVAHWLHGVAYHASLKARSVAVRRGNREKQAMIFPEPASAPPAANDWHALLDREINLLPEKYQSAIVLCDLEGKSYKEAAASLGCPEGTLAARLARGRALLARKLQRHGAGVALAAILTQTSEAAPSPALASATIQLGRSLISDPATALLPPAVALLMNGALKAMLLNKLRIPAILVILTASCFWGAWSLAPASQAPAPPAAFAQDSPDKTTPPEKIDPKTSLVEKEQQNLQGEWLEVAKNGAVRENGQKMVFHGANFTWGSVLDWEAMKGPYAVDPGKKLKELDLHFLREGKAVTARCIYILEGDLLKICYSEPDRPTAFKDVSPNLPRVYLWQRKKLEAANKEEPKKKDEPKNQGAAFSPDGARIAVRKDKEIFVLDIQTDKILMKMQGHDDDVTALAYSPDGKLLASGGKDKKIFLWDAATGRNLLQFKVPGLVQVITFTVDGNTLVVLEADQTVREFEAATGKLLRVTKGNGKQ